MTEPSATPAPSRLTHILAIVTIVVALPLVLLGAEVTTKRVGMVDDVAVRSPFYFVTEWLSQQSEQSLGWKIEHGHRQMGWLVGMLEIATLGAAILSFGLTRITALCGVTLAAIVIQGLLGIFRIDLNAVIGSTAALVHGAFAPVVLSLLLTQALATGSHWRLGVLDPVKAKKLRVWCVITSVTLLTQIVLGGFIRHKDELVAFILHLTVALVAFAFVFVVIKFALSADRPSFKMLSRVVMALMTIQLLIGGEVGVRWWGRHFAPHTAAQESVPMQLTRSAHYVIGAFLFATVVAIAAKAIWAPATLQEAAA